MTAKVTKNLQPQAVGPRRRPQGHRCDQERQRHIDGQYLRQLVYGLGANSGGTVENCDQESAADQQVDRSRQLAVLQRRKRQGRERDELALWHKNNARHRVDKHQRDSQQDVYGAVGHGVLRKPQSDVDVHGWAARARTSKRE